MALYLTRQTDAQCGAGLARLFSTSVIKELACKGFSTIATRILDETRLLPFLDPTMLLRDFFEELFALLFRSYRNEYIYKNAIANKILLGRHSLRSSFMLTEFRAANCKADAVILNGTSNVYEIKSEFDNLDRLKRQISAYSLLFDHVHVITSAEQLQKIRNEVDESIGLMVLNDRHQISTVRNSRSMKQHVQPEAIFDSLRKHEYMQVIIEKFGRVPDVPNTRIYNECKHLFCKLPPEVAHDAMVFVLQRRGDCRAIREFVTNVPPSLRALSLSCNLSRREQTAFLNVLNTNTGDCFSSG
ncbi:MAG: sce7726 family protein [Syntrophales bacterium]|jgi:hypothetical protein